MTLKGMETYFETFAAFFITAGVMGTILFLMASIFYVLKKVDSLSQ